MVMMGVGVASAVFNVLWGETKVRSNMDPCVVPGVPCAAGADAPIGVIALACPSEAKAEVKPLAAKVATSASTRRCRAGLRRNTGESSSLWL